MKLNNILITINIFIIGFFSCSNKQHLDKDYLYGNWSFIEYDSIYHEVFIDSNKFYYYLENYELYRPLYYKLLPGDKIVFYEIVKNDTLFNKEFNPVSNFCGANRFEFIHNEKIDLYLRIDSSEFTINRINNEADLKKYRTEYFRRKLKFLVSKNLADSSELVNFKSYEIIQMDMDSIPNKE